MISVEEALAHVLSGIEPLPGEQVSLGDALGRVLARDVTSRVSHPPAAVSAMDGYAVMSGDVATVPAILERIGESAAGQGFDGALDPGQCVRIFTGAPVPGGADAIVMQEDAEVDGTKVTLNEKAVPGRHIRPQGLDFKAGETLLRQGCLLTARDIGLAAAMNVPWLTVRRRPRVAILATGDELVMPGDPLGPEQIISSNSLALAAYVQALGGEPLILGIARDSTESLNALLDGAPESDLLVTLGGASVGDYDLVGQALKDRGLELGFYKVAMRPGKPLIFGRLGRVRVLGLPGNPVSAGVTTVVFLKPAMEAMLDLPSDDGPGETALLGRDLSENDHRQDYLRATLALSAGGEAVATPFDVQDSSMMARLAQADCLVVRPPQAPAAQKGERVQIISLRLGQFSM